MEEVSVFSKIVEAGLAGLFAIFAIFLTRYFLTYLEKRDEVVTELSQQVGKLTQQIANLTLVISNLCTQMGVKRPKTVPLVKDEEEEA